MSKNYIRFYEKVQLDKISGKDDYNGAFGPGPSNMHPSGLGTIPEEESVSVDSGDGIFARIKASHAGIVTLNHGMYLPDKMAAGVKTFTQNYNKPILVHHDDLRDAVGRVYSSRYVDTSNTIQDNLSYVSKNGFILDKKQTQKLSQGKLPYSSMIDTVIALVDAEIEGFTGLGYAEVIARITDPDAVQKLIDGRYLSTSIGVTTDQAVCSICKSDLLKDGRCEHIPGKVYDGQKCFLITGNLDYEEVSLVNTPADPNSGVFELSYQGFTDSIHIANDYDGSYCTGNLCFYNLEETAMPKKDAKKKEQEAKKDDFLAIFLSDTRTDEEVAKFQDMLWTTISTAIEDKKLEGDFTKIEDLSALPPSAIYKGIVPMTDSAYLFAAKDFAEKLEDEAKKEMLEAIAGKEAGKEALENKKEEDKKEEKVEDEKESDPEAANKDSHASNSMLHSIIQMVDENNYWNDNPVLSASELAFLQKMAVRLAGMMSSEDNKNGEALREIKLFADGMDASDLRDKVAALEAAVATSNAALADAVKKSDVLAKEYSALFADVDYMTKRVTDQKLKTRLEQEKLYKLYSILDNKADADPSVFTDTALHAENLRLSNAVDTEKIVAKLSDGMARKPSGTIDNPLEDEKEVVGTEISIEEMKDFQTQHMQMMFQNSAKAEMFRIDTIARWKREGRTSSLLTTESDTTGGNQ